MLLLEPENKLALLERARLKKAQTEYKTASRNLAKRMFEKSRTEEDNSSSARGSSSGSKEAEGADVEKRGRSQPKVKPVQAAGAGSASQESDSNLVLLLVTAAVALIAAIMIGVVDLDHLVAGSWRAGKEG